MWWVSSVTAILFNCKKVNLFCNLSIILPDTFELIERFKDTDLPSLPIEWKADLDKSERKLTELI